MNVEMPFTEIFYTSSNNNKAILSFLAEADQKLEICQVDFVEGGWGLCDFQKSPEHYLETICPSQ